MILGHHWVFIWHPIRTICLAVAVRDLPSKGVTIVTGVGRDTGARNHTAIMNLLSSLQQEGALVRDFKDNQGWFTVRLLPPA